MGEVSTRYLSTEDLGELMRDHHVVTPDGYTHYLIPASGKSALQFAYDKQAAVELYREGYTIRQIADRLNLGYHTVYGWKRRGYLLPKT